MFKRKLLALEHQNPENINIKGKHNIFMSIYDCKYT